MNVVLLRENFVARPTDLIKIHSMSKQDIKIEKKYKFEFEANKEIESVGKLDWKSFKKLKSMNDEGQDFDLFDLQNF